VITGHAAAQADSAAPQQEVSEIVVTGTRITRDGYTAPTPVTVATTESLQRTTPSSLPDGLNKLPQFTNSSSPSRSSLNFANTPTHGNNLNLRGVGPTRTLNLFDGIRIPATTFAGTVDVDVLPQLLIQRIDTVTGGASAAYGSDAVSGVVNFVLNKNFTGVTGIVQGGVSTHGDNGNERIGIADGFKFAQDRGHVLLSAEYSNNDGMLRNARATGRTGYTYAGATPGCVNTTTDPTACQPGGTLNPYVAIAGARFSNATPYGNIVGSSVANNPYLNYVFNPDGTYRPFVNGAPTGSAYQIGGDGYSIPTDTSAVAPLKTYQTFGRVSYDLNDKVNVYAQGVFSRSDLSFTSLAAGLIAPANAKIYKNNPFLPAAIAATLPTDNDYINVNNYAQFGPHPHTKERTDFYLGAAGLDIQLSNSWKGSLAFTHGESHFTSAQSGTYDYRKAYAALDAVIDPATGKATCAVLLNPTYAASYAGCQPLNVLGDPSALTPAGFDYATGTSRYKAITKQDSIVGSVSGEVFDLPAGPVSIAIGGEYRHESLKLTSNADPSLLDTDAERVAYFAGPRGVPLGANGLPASSLTAYYLTNIGSADGSRNVAEAFGEIAAPILKDKPFAESLDLSAAGRITHYSTTGTVETWKLGGTYKPIHDVLFRATYSKDIRAPNLYELFAGSSVSIGTLIDPVSGTTGIFNAVSGGNPDLKPEVGKTLTFGTVVTPGFLPGFSLAVDYYKLKISDQISTLTAQQILNNCLSLGASTPECALITRPTPTSFPSLLRLVPANIAFLDTRGVDFDASYHREVGDGELSLRLYANYLQRYRSKQYANAPVVEYSGASVVNSTPIGYPKWRGTLTADYQVGGFGVTVSEQFIDSVRLFIPLAPSTFVDPKVPSVWYTDLSVRYRLPAFKGGVEVFGTVNNLFNKKPPLIPGTTLAVNLPTNMSLYDQVGRTFTGGFRFKF
jgi:outer membrane receptor protein involved in Fe transport